MSIPNRASQPKAASATEASQAHAARLSPAQRNTLFAIALGGLRNRAALPHRTILSLDSLRNRGLLDTDYEPTAAGRAVFGNRSRAMFAVWHLIGPQGCGKTLYANATILALHKLGEVGVRMETWEFERAFAGNPARVAHEHPDISVLLLENNATSTGRTPPHFMFGDRVIDLTGHMVMRRPGIEGIQAKIRINQPDWPEGMVQTQSKHQYERGFRLEASTC